MLRKFSLLTVVVTALGLVGVPAAQAATSAAVRVRPAAVHAPAQQPIASTPHPIRSRLAVHPAPKSVGLRGTFPTTNPAVAPNVVQPNTTTPTIGSPVEEGIESLTPAMSVVATDSGTLTTTFWARHVGSSSWDILNGATVSGTSGARVAVTIPAGMLRIGQAFEWQARTCNASSVCSAYLAVQTGYASPAMAAGNRAGATRLPFAVGHGLSASVDVGTGNLYVQANQLTLPGVTGTTSLGVDYNSLVLATGSRYGYGDAGHGWRSNTGEGIAVAVYGASAIVMVTYLGPGSATDVFKSTAGVAGSYTSLDGGKHTLTYQNQAMTVGGVSLGTVYMSIYDHQSGATSYFNANGRLVASADRNSNVTLWSYNTAGLPTQVTNDPAHLSGPDPARTAQVSFDPASVWLTGIAQTGRDGTSRTVAYGYNAAGDLASITDTAGDQTSFGYDTGHDLTSITAPGGATTTVGYDSLHRVVAVDQQNPSAPGDATTRLDYTDGSQTLLAGPNTDQNMAPGLVPHTTYTVGTDGYDRISKTVDAAGHTRSTTYTGFGDTATATNGNGGTTTNTYGANGGESPTQSTSPTGSSATASYGNTGASQYLPSAAADPQGNSSTYTYDGTGNATKSTNGMAAAAQVDHNTDGTVKTSTDPNGHVTSYGYDTNQQLASITPPAGNSLGVRHFSYDTYGRLATATDGRGIVTSYTYNTLDQVTKVAYSDYSHSVVYTYDAADNVRTRIDGTGTTTDGYDPQGRLTALTHTSGGGTLTYAYDKAGNLTAETNGNGTTAYGYDPANQLTSLTTPAGTVLRFGYDANGSRTDTWFNTNTDNTVWTVHTKIGFDSSGRQARIQTFRGSNDTTATADTSYCYAKYVVGQPCPTATSTADTGLIQYSTDNVSGVRTVNTYDQANRLTAVTPTAGTTYAYGYDPDGNRTSATGGQSLTFNSANQISSTGYGYDAAGNRNTDPIGTVSYDGPGRMVSKTGTANGSYTYAGTTSDELTGQTVPGGTTINYVYGRSDAHGVPVIDSVTKGTQTASYVIHDPSGAPLVLQTNNGTENYYVVDNLGSPTTLINTSNTITAAYTYDPYGTTLTSTGVSAGINPYRYAGGLYDRTTNWTKFGARFQDPTTGTFTQPDSVTHLANPNNGNQYAYAGDNPANNVDPSGGFYVGTSFLSLTGYFNETETEQLAIATEASDPISAALPPPFDFIAAAYLFYLSIEANFAIGNSECLKVNTFADASPYSGEHCTYGEGA